MTYEGSRAGAWIQASGETRIESCDSMVRLHLDSFRPGDDDDACHLMGMFRRKAREQGWSETDIDRACRSVEGRQVQHCLSSYIEPTEREPLSCARSSTGCETMPKDAACSPKTRR